MRKHFLFLISLLAMVSLTLIIYDNTQGTNLQLAPSTSIEDNDVGEGTIDLQQAPSSFCACPENRMNRIISSSSCESSAAGSYATCPVGVCYVCSTEIPSGGACPIENIELEHCTWISNGKKCGCTEEYSSLKERRYYDGDKLKGIFQESYTCKKVSDCTLNHVTGNKACSTGTCGYTCIWNWNSASSESWTEDKSCTGD